MSKQKKCPKCGYVTDDLQFVFCPCCDEEIKLVEVGAEHPDVPVATADSTTLASNEQSNVQILDSGNVVAGGVNIDSLKNKDTETSISLGTGNAVSGGIHSSTTVNDSSSKVVNVYSTQVAKSPAEILIENKKLYRSRAKELFYDGFITDEGVKELEELRISLGLDADIATTIREEVKNLSIKTRTELPIAGKIKLETAQLAIAQNNQATANSIIAELEGWMKRIDSNELSQMYYQLSAILTPAKYIRELSENKSEGYWKTYWSYVAYSLQGLNAKSEAAIAELTAWDSFYPQQNQLLLMVVGAMMKNDEVAVRLAYGQLSNGISQELTQVKNAVSELLDTNFETSLTADISTGTKFYASNLFPKFMESIEAKKKINDANKLEAAALEERKREKIRYQKEILLHEYEMCGTTIDEACRKSGISLHSFQTWFNEDAIFADTYNSITSIIEKKKADEIVLKRKQTEQEVAEIQQKRAFAMLYKENECDMLKTCTEIGASVADCKRWRATDAAFNDEMTYIEREKKFREREASNLRRKRMSKKLLPYLIATIVIVAGCFALKTCKEQKEAERIEQYNRDIKELEHYSELFKEVHITSTDFINRLSLFEKTINLYSKVFDSGNIEDYDSKILKEVQDKLEIEAKYLQGFLNKQEEDKYINERKMFKELKNKLNI